FRHNTRHRYLLRCLLTCASCGLAMFGAHYPATARQPERHYYECRGKDPVLSARRQICTRRAVRAYEMEAAVWEHLRGLLEDPGRLVTQFEAFVQEAAEGDEHEQAERRRLAARLERLGREQQRLLDAYQAAVIELGELAQRRVLLEQRRRGLLDQQAQWERLRRERLHAQDVLCSLRAFCARVRDRLATMPFEERQELLQLLVERIIVG